MTTFAGYNDVFPNDGIHLLLAETIKFRKQLTARDEFKSQSGWGDNLNAYMVTELDKLADTLESITYNTDGKTMAQRKEEASDTSRSLADDYSATSITMDEVLMPSFPPRRVEWVLDGSDADLPIIDNVNFPNDDGRSFIKGLDRFFVAMTRLDSRFQPVSITKYESVMMRGILDGLYTLAQRKGGEFNKSDIPTGTLPSQQKNLE